MKYLITATFLFFVTNLHAKDIYKESFHDGVYVIDGDIPVLSLEAMLDFVKKPRSNELIINTLANNVYDKWSEVQRFELTYCISNSFEENKDKVVQAIEISTRDWMEAANVRFIYLSEEDHRCDQRNQRVLFDIRPVYNQSYLARAFFPSYPRRQRNILIDDSAISFNIVALTGFIRHELGHVLGFRHEHIHPEASGCDEDNNFAPLTNYDKSSVMHYPQCGGENEIENMILTESDREGAAAFYP